MSAGAARRARSRRCEVEERQVYVDRRAARPHRPVADRQAARLQRAARRAVDAGDPAAPAGRGRRPRRHLRRHPRGRRARPPSVRLVRDLGRALRRAGGRRPRRARDQDDRVPHDRRHAARARADPRHRARQAGGVPGRAQGALRRAREHPVGARAGGGGRPRRLRAPGAQDARQVPARRAPRGRRRAPLRPHRDRQLPPADGAPVHRLRPVHLRRADRRRRRRHVQLPHRLRAPAALPQGAGGAQLPARRDDRRDRAHRRRARGGPARAHRDEDELARRPALHPRALPGVAGRRARRPQHPRDLLPGAGRAGRLGEHPRQLGRRAASSSTRGSSPSSATARPRSTSARPTSCRATSTRASSS